MALSSLSFLSAAKNLRTSGGKSPLRKYYVYIMTNQKRTLYTGVTNVLARRVYEHKLKLVDGFTKKYNLGWLAYYEATDDIESAIAREKQIKGWLRRKKMALVESTNPRWVDLARGWFDCIETS
jgi:putative endonuclease